MDIGRPSLVVTRISSPVNSFLQNFQSTFSKLPSLFEGGGKKLVIPCIPWTCLIFLEDAYPIGLHNVIAYIFDVVHKDRTMFTPHAIFQIKS